MAARIATALNQHYTVINIDAVYAGALLHDIARTEKNHANIGAKWISERGYPQIAKLIETHMQLDEQQRKQITEHTVVYLADKLVIGNREVTLRERFLDRFCQCDLESQQRVHMRYLQAVEVYRLVNNFIEEDLISYEEVVI
jgi:hypothetical protein